MRSDNDEIGFSYAFRAGQGGLGIVVAEAVEATHASVCRNAQQSAISVWNISALFPFGIVHLFRKGDAGGAGSEKNGAYRRMQNHLERAGTDLLSVLWTFCVVLA